MHTYVVERDVSVAGEPEPPNGVGGGSPQDTLRVQKMEIQLGGSVRALPTGRQGSEAISAAGKATAIHISTSRLTQTINLHTFHISPALGLNWTPSQHIELQLPPELDLISGRAALDDEARRLQLTPCRYKHMCDGANIDDKKAAKTDAVDVSTLSHDTVEIQFVTRSGTLTSQIGLPRFRALEASVLGCGGGFPARLFRGIEAVNPDSEGATGVTVAVAGGVGICAFLAIADRIDIDAAQVRTEDNDYRNGKENVKSPVLFWTLHVDDWEFVRFVIQNGRLAVGVWSRIHVFLTCGTDKITPGRAKGVIEDISKLLNVDERLICHFRRMQVDDVERVVESRTNIASCRPGVSQRGCSTIHFCGGKSLEWQIKRWSRSMKTSVAVYTTKMQK
ncbi:hypothetical protein LTR84_003810 [Exophiala bonariae]|uniref:FAD-binding FR-type domain-containing protein n=1 Tax=Exophiala bonariae TaxID=1690606 RepID=A0AAV9N642_9EURO|nr:hypothetical protein LTR84_003810 [Exophiala bonariae]